MDVVCVEVMVQGGRGVRDDAGVILVLGRRKTRTLLQSVALKIRTNPWSNPAIATAEDDPQDWNLPKPVTVTYEYVTSTCQICSRIYYGDI